MILGIILGVAMAVSIDIANASAGRAFDLSTEAVTGPTTHQIVGGPAGLPDLIYTTLRVNGIVDSAAPVIFEYITSPDLSDRPLQLFGVDPFAESDFRPYLSADVERQPRQFSTRLTLLNQPGAILISSNLAAEFDLSGCPDQISEVDRCEIEIRIAGRSEMVRVVGLIESAGGSKSSEISQQLLGDLLLTDIATAQELTGRVGLLDRIDLILPESCISDGFNILRTDDPGCPEAERILGDLPPGTSLVSVEDRTGNLAQMTGAFKLNLTALSLLASIVGMFLIYNTMTFSVLQRRSTFGILRSIGGTRREIFSLILVESMLVGIVGAVAGVGLGILLGQGAVRLVTQTITDLYYVVSVRGVQVPFTSLVKGLVLGVTTTVFSAVLPAWEAAGSPPRGLLSRAVIEEKANRAVLAAGWGGVALLICGGVLLWMPSNNLILGFAGTFAIIIGFALLAPITTRILIQTIIRILGSKLGILARMAPREVVQSLSRTSVAVAALTIAVSVTIGISVMVSSFRSTIVTWLDETLLGDIYLSVPSFSGIRSSSALDPAIIRLARDQPEVARVDSLRSVDVDSPRGLIHIAATDNPTLVQERIYLSRIGTLGDVDDALDTGSILVSEPLARRLGLDLGAAQLSLDTQSGPRDFPIVGIYYDYASSQGTVMMRLSSYRENWSDSGVSALAIRLAPEADPGEIVAQWTEVFSPIQQLQIRPNRDLRQDALAVFDRTFAITRALRLLALVVAFIGILSALLSWQLEKQREAGILRAIGLTTRQLWGLVLAETGLMGIVAGLLAIPTGLALASILVYIINLRSFGWTLQMHLESSPFILGIVLSFAASISAGLLPAARLSRIRPAEVLRME
jgi:putative ABC transport system permease protein